MPRSVETRLRAVKRPETGAWRRLLRLPPRGRNGQWLFALGLALVLAVQPIWPDRTAIAVIVALSLTLAAATRWQLRWAPVAVLIGCAIVLRLAMLSQESSDVADVTQAAIRTMLDGGDPYGIGYIVSRPAGSPFPYGPVVLAWYLPSLSNPRLLELLVSIGLAVLFGIRAARGRPVGLVVFALAPPLVLASVDGSNDTSAGLLILVALVAAGRRPILGAVLLAVAVAFKQYAIAWVPPLVLWAGLPTLLAFAGASIVAWSPVLLVWGPGSFLRSLEMAQETHLRQSYWSLGAILDQFALGALARSLETIRYFASGAIAILGGRRVRSIDGVIVIGAIAFLVAQFGGYFGSYVYLAALAPILCWRVDDWLARSLPALARAYGQVPGMPHRLHVPVAASAPARVAPAARAFVAQARTGPAPVHRARVARPTRDLA